jgi:hypothetical protein
MDYFNKPIGEQMAANQNNENNQQPTQQIDPNQPNQETKDSGYDMQNIATTAQNTFSSIGEGLSDMRTSLDNTVKDFSSKDLASSGEEFINSNSIIAKFVFLLLVLIFFVLLMNLGIYLIAYFSIPLKTPYLVKGRLQGNMQKIIPQDPKKDGSKMIYRSNNKNDGIEFTWSIWLRRGEISLSSDSQLKQFEHVFSKGVNLSNNPEQDMGNGPGLYFYNPPSSTPSVPSTMQNILKVYMDTITVNSENMNYEVATVDNLPFKNWFHLAIRMENKVMDIYINGTIAKRVTFQDVPKQNYGDVFVCNNGGFTGELSDLRYFDYGLGVFEIMNIVNRGPNLTSSDANKTTSYDYLSNTWYM